MSRKPKSIDHLLDMPFVELPTLLLERLANALSKHGELMYQRLFGIHLSECRVLAIVLSHQPLSLREVCNQLELDKGHVSRLISRLVASGLLERRTDQADQRSSHLVLTQGGRELAMRIHAAAVERNRYWMSGLGSEKETLAFMKAMRLLSERADELLIGEASRSGMVVPRFTRTSRDAAAQGSARRSVVVDRPALEEIRRQIERLLGDEPDV